MHNFLYQSHSKVQIYKERRPRELVYPDTCKSTRYMNLGYRIYFRYIMKYIYIGREARERGRKASRMRERVIVSYMQITLGYNDTESNSKTKVMAHN